MATKIGCLLPSDISQSSCWRQGMLMSAKEPRVQCKNNPAFAIRNERWEGIYVSLVKKSPTTNSPTKLGGKWHVTALGMLNCFRVEVVLTGWVKYSSPNVQQVQSSSRSPAVWTSVMGDKLFGVDTWGNAWKWKMSAWHACLYVCSLWYFWAEACKATGSDTCF